MSSGISIDETGRLKPATTTRADEGRLKPATTKPATTKPVTTKPAADRFQAWHFFLLASILLATAGVTLTRRTTPEQLILLSLTIGAAGAVAAGLYRTLQPLASSDPAAADEPLTEGRRAALAREKVLTLRAIKELEFDRAMNKLSQKDFDEMAGRLRRRALALMKQLDEGGGYAAAIERELESRLAGSRGSLGSTGSEGSRGSCTCGTVNDADALFCKRCGTRLQAS